MAASREATPLLLLRILGLLHWLELLGLCRHANPNHHINARRDPRSPQERDARNHEKHKGRYLHWNVHHALLEGGGGLAPPKEMLKVK